MERSPKAVLANFEKNGGGEGGGACWADRFGKKSHVNCATPWKWHCAAAPATAVNAAQWSRTLMPLMMMSLISPAWPAPTTLPQRRQTHTHIHTHIRTHRRAPTQWSAQRARGRRRKRVFSQSNGLNLFIHYGGCLGDRWPVSVRANLKSVYTIPLMFPSHFQFFCLLLFRLITR